VTQHEIKELFLKSGCIDNGEICTKTATSLSYNEDVNVTGRGAALLSQSMCNGKTNFHLAIL